MSDVCYVIASGPSLLGFDFDALPSGFRIGANRSAWLANCDALCTVDQNFHRREPDRIKAFGPNAHIALCDQPQLYPEATYWAFARGLNGLALTPQTLTGSNSGFAAFNLAIQLGYKEIALLGFDYQWHAGRSHFHEGYGQKLHIQRQLATWVRAYDEAVRQIRPLGINVTNFVGPMGSLLKVFPTAPLAELL